MDMITLPAQARETGKSPNALRREKKVPAVVYGNVEQTVPIQCDEAALHKAFLKAGESALVELHLEDRKIPVLFKDITFHSVSGMELHADFYAVNMKEEIETEVPIELTGESPAVTELSGVLVTALDTVTVRCLPGDLPHEIPVDISALKEFGDVITVADLSLPKGVTIMNDAETVLLTVQEPREEEPEEPPAPAEGEATAEGAEGAAPAAEGAEGEKKED